MTKTKVRQALDFGACRILPSPWGADNTQKILDVLDEYGIKATFFVVGAWAEQYPDTARAIVAHGHELMNHSGKHDHYNSLTADQIVADVEGCNRTIEALTGVTPTLIRCPFGEYDNHVISAIRSIGMEPIQWDVERSQTGEGPFTEREACRAVSTSPASAEKKSGAVVVFPNPMPHRLDTGGVNAMEIRQTHPEHATEEERMERLASVRQTCAALIRTQRRKEALRQGKGA